MLRSKIMVICFLFAGLVSCLSLLNTFAGDIDTDEIYAEKCALCHGDDDNFVNSITNGNPENSNYLPFGDMLSEEEIAAMAAHVRKFAQ